MRADPSHSQLHFVYKKKYHLLRKIFHLFGKLQKYLHISQKKQYLCSRKRFYIIQISILFTTENRLQR